MRQCSINEHVQCSSTDDNFCGYCYDKICLDFVTQQVSNGASFEEAVRKLGYYPMTFTPPNCESNVKGKKEVLLEQLLEEVKRIKLILTVGKEI